MIQDISPEIFYNQYINAEPEAKDYVLSFFEDKLLTKDGDNLEFPSWGFYREGVSHQGQSTAKTNRADNVQTTYLFSIDEKRFFMIEEEEEPSLENFSLQSINKVRGYEEMDMMMAAATGWHLYVWYHNNHFCGRCGGKTVHDDKERMLKCSCGNMIYPKVAPAVIVGITAGDSILLSTYSGRLYKRYALIAGFVEIGETIEETVKREVMEEVGLEVTNLRYYKSQPWGFDSNVLMGYFCDVKGSRELTIDTSELSGAQWVKREDISDYNEGISLTHEMMMVFKYGEGGEYNV